ncbi:hypothetical protein AB0C76_32080 [Kitasatospora sp. NPDC048722]|uniref:hypothetical protein n=1 Tax=Kitasatospora sp. NPDC048722 TaxID=3155639 RepID=UPI0033F4E9F1
MDWSVLLGGIFGLMAASLGAWLAYAFGERRTARDRAEAAENQRKQEWDLGRREAAIVLAQASALLEESQPAFFYLWSQKNERVRELRGRWETLRANLYHLASLPLFGELSIAIDGLAQGIAESVNYATRDFTGYGLQGEDYLKERFDEALKPWKSIRSELDLEDVLRDPVWGHDVETEKYRRRNLEKITAEFGENLSVERK